jgi:hypothetical protein
MQNTRTVQQGHTLLVAFGENRIKPDRARALNALKDKQWVTFRERSDHSQWEKDVQSHRFTLCPHGHGLDTHRTWEVLLLGGVPVVRHSSMDSMYEGLPIVMVAEWSDVTETRLAEAWLWVQTTPFHMDRVFWPYWQGRLELARAQARSWGVQRCDNGVIGHHADISTRPAQSETPLKFSWDRQASANGAFLTTISAIVHAAPPLQLSDDITLQAHNVGAKTAEAHQAIIKDSQVLPAPEEPCPLGVLWQTGPSEQRTDVRGLFEKNRKFLPPAITWQYLDDDEMDASMRQLSVLLEEKGVVSGAFDAYVDLVPFAFRADLWRAAIVWAHGGFYLDHKIVLFEHYSSWVNNRTWHLSMCNDAWPAGAKFNAMFAARSRDPALASVVKRLVAHIKIRFMGNPDKLPPELHVEIAARVKKRPHLAITGPIAWGWATRGLPLHSNCTYYKLHGSGRVMAGQDTRLHKRGRECDHCNNYDRLFAAGKVYCGQLNATEFVVIHHRCTVPRASIVPNLKSTPA